MVLGWRRRHERVAHALYCQAVAAAREPWFYTSLGVPDTLDGRFDMVGLHVILLIRRLQAMPAPGPEVAQAVFDAMFSDMDVSLREMGVSDLSVGKRVRAMWEALHGRAAAYQEPLAAGDAAALAAALARNVFRDAAATGKARGLAEAMLRQDRHLAALPAAALLGGGESFAPVELTA
jgi:cytochrome b pre-mRNA-processing protein 3